jgi:hypothetical protein
MQFIYPWPSLVQFSLLFGVDMLRMISLFLLLIISRISFADTIDATPLDNQQSALLACKSITYSDITKTTGESGGSILSASVVSIPNPSTVLCAVSYTLVKWGSLNNSSVQLFRPFTTLYTCPSGYTQSDSAGTASISGAFCTKPDVPADKTCAELAADGSYELGSGYFVAGHASTYCYQANPTHICQISNNGESIYFGKVSDTCSIGMGGGSYWSYTGSDCTSVGPSVNYYKTSQAASLACNPTLPDGASSADSTAPDVPDTDTPPPCPYGSGSITNGPETMTVCLDSPLSSPTSSSTPTSDSSSDGDTPSTDNSTPSTDNSTTTNNTTTNNTSTSNNSSSTSNSTSNNTSTTNNDNSTTNTSGGSSSGSSGSSSGTGGSGSATSGASGTGGSGTATSGASGTGTGGDGDSVSGAESTCPEGDDFLSCATLGTAPESEALKPTEVNFGYTPDAAWWGGSGSGSGGSCVADYKVSSDISVSYEPLCKTLTSVRPVLLGVCFLISATILFGFRRNGGDD